MLIFGEMQGWSKSTMCATGSSFFRY